MLTVVTWLWSPRFSFRSSYGPQHVNRLAAMVRAHYAEPHRIVVVTDLTQGLDPAIEVVKDTHDFATVPSPHGGKNPTCYRRLRMFRPDIATVFGSRFVSLDLDAVIVGDLAPLWTRPEPFVAWADVGGASRYNGSMILMSAGARPEVWTSFDPARSPKAAQRAGQFGSDQGHISAVLGPDQPAWRRADGVLSYRYHVQGTATLPPGARIVFFHGDVKPDSPEAQRLPWVRAHYPLEVAA